MDETDFVMENYPGFIESMPNLRKASQKAFDVDISERKMSDYLIFVLSKLCLDRFDDVCFLAAHGRGDGCSPLVRAMFEGLVNARYILLKPEKAEEFSRYSAIYLKKVHRQIERFNKISFPDVMKASLEEAWKVIGKTDKEIPSQPDWTDLPLVERADKVGLGDCIALAYYRQMEIAHPSMLHVLSQAEEREGERFIFANAEASSRERVREALIISHRLSIEVLILLHETFGDDELKPLIGQCLADMGTTWSGT